jgi:8-oxo-dGTP diphosphatase
VTPSAQAGTVRDDLAKVVAAVVERNGHVLIGKRPDKKLFGGKWEFPGGKIEAGETQHDALRRELWEELQVDVVETEEKAHFSVEEPRAAAVIYYVSTSIRGREQSIEHQELTWVAIRDLLKYDLAPSDRAYAEFRLSTLK